MAPNLVLTVSMDILVELGFETPNLRFEEPRVGVETKRVVKLVGTALAETSFGAVSSDVEGLTAQVISRDDPAGPVRELEVRLKPTKTGAVHGSVRVTTTLPHMPALTLPVYAHVKGDATVEPRVAVFGAGKPDESVTMRVSATRPGLKITSVTDDSGYVIGKATAEKDGTTSVTLTLAPAPKLAPERFSTVVRLTTTWPEEPTIEITATRGGPGQRPLPAGPGRRAPAVRPVPTVPAQPAAPTRPPRS